MSGPGTYNFDPTSGALVINAFAKCGLGPHQLSAEHLKQAEFEANLLNVDISNRNPNGFELESATQTLSTSATYTLNGRVVSIAIAYVTNDSDDTCRVVSPVSMAEYAAITDKTTTATGGPTSYFLSMLKTPTITVWPLVSSDDTVTYTLNMMTFRQNQDFELDFQYTTDLPYRFLDAFAMGLAARLADIYRQERADRFYALYESKFQRLAAQDQEDVPLYISPDMSGYLC